MGIGGISEIKMEGVSRAEEERKQTVAEREQSVALTLRSVTAGVDVGAGALVDDRVISQVANDSRKVRPGALFVAVRGVATDGNLYAKAAADRGAVAVVSETPAPAGWDATVPWIEVKDGRKALATSAACLFLPRPAARSYEFGLPLRFAPGRTSFPNEAAR